MRDFSKVAISNEIRRVNMTVADRQEPSIRALKQTLAIVLDRHMTVISRHINLIRLYSAKLKRVRHQSRTCRTHGKS
jgi:hypothetical protein